MTQFRNPGNTGVDLCKCDISNSSAELASDRRSSILGVALKYSILCTCQASAGVQSKSPFFRNVAPRHLIVGARSFETAWLSYFQGQQCVH